MILGGALVKSYYGIQGNLILKEGTVSSELIVQGEVLLGGEGVEIINRYPHHHQIEKKHSLEEYLEGITLSLRDRWTGEKSPILDKPELILEPVPTLLVGKYRVPLAGDDALITYPRGRYAVVITSPKTTIPLQDGTTALFTKEGRIYFANPKMVMYGEGRGGYAEEWVFEISEESEFDKESRLLEEAKLAVQTAIQSANKVASPIEAFERNGEALIHFLDRWERQGTFLFEGRTPYPLDLSEIPAEELKGAFWAVKMIDQFEVEGDIQKKPWSLLLTAGQTPEESRESLLSQMIMIAKDLPEADLEAAPPQKILSALLKSYALTYSSLVRPSEKTAPFAIETPYQPVYEPLPLPSKAEEARPLIHVRAGTEEALIPFDPHGKGLKTAMQGGNILLHYRSKTIELPVSVRLSDARTIRYPGSERPFSYEADVEIGGDSTTLSMNHVYETWDGTRFYLSNISPQEETKAKTVQIVVNKDPGKYFLTYPGGVLLALGITLLFFRTQLLQMLKKGTRRQITR